MKMVANEVGSVVRKNSIHASPCKILGQKILINVTISPSVASVDLKINDERFSS